MKINNWKQYLTVVLLNLLMCAIFRIGCTGERCMIMIPAIFYALTAIISHLPYLFLKPFNKINTDKILAFIFPSFLMIIIIFLSLTLGSNITLNSNNNVWIVISILPYTIIQLIFYYRIRLKIDTTKSEGG